MAINLQKKKPIGDASPALPLMHKGWLIKKLGNGYVSLSNPGTGKSIGFDVPVAHAINLIDSLK